LVSELVSTIKRRAYGVMDVRPSDPSDWSFYRAEVKSGEPGRQRRNFRNKPQRAFWFVFTAAGRALARLCGATYLLEGMSTCARNRVPTYLETAGDETATKNRTFGDGLDFGVSLAGGSGGGVQAAESAVLLLRVSPGGVRRTRVR
jgi:hypothetical protein